MRKKQVILLVGYLRGKIIKELAIGTELKDEENVGGRLKDVLQVDDVLVSLHEAEDVNLAERLITQVEPVIVHNVVRHVDYFHGEALPGFLEGEQVHTQVPSR
jgi:hypothetical protein